MLVFRLMTIFLIAGLPAMASGEAQAKDPKQILKAMDRNGDGKISSKEWKKKRKAFKKLDGNGDGYLTIQELPGYTDSGSIGGGKSAAKSSAGKSSAAKSNTAAVGGWQGPFIDAHSQIDEKTDVETLIPMLNQAGVAQVILSTRFKQPSSDVLELAARHPGRIIPAAKSKTKAFTKNTGKFPGTFFKELEKFDYRAVAEIIMWHAAKKKVGAGKATMDPDDPRIAVFMDTARKKGFPFIAHVEFGAMRGDKSRYMKKLENFFAANRDVPIGMIHMGQLKADDAARLLPKHPNLFFITSHCNPVAYNDNKQTWTRMIVGTKFAPEWRALVLANPTRFVLAFDNVFAFQWEDSFLPQVVVWRKALATVPNDVAHALAHGNAERLWKLPPAVRP